MKTMSMSFFCSFLQLVLFLHTAFSPLSSQVFFIFLPQSKNMLWDLSVDMWKLSRWAASHVSQMKNFRVQIDYVNTRLVLRSLAALLMKDLQLCYSLHHGWTSLLLKEQSVGEGVEVNWEKYLVPPFSATVSLSSSEISSYLSGSVCTWLWVSLSDVSQWMSILRNFSPFACIHLSARLIWSIPNAGWFLLCSPRTLTWRLSLPHYCCYCCIVTGQVVL